MVKCLESHDDTIRRITLELLFNNTNSGNIEIIIEKFMESLKRSTNLLFKKNLTEKIFDLCVRYSKTKNWLVSKVDQIFQFAQDHIKNSMLHHFIAILEENLFEEDFAVFLTNNYLQKFSEDSLSSKYIRLISWVIGNAGVLAYKSE